MDKCPYIVIVIIRVIVIVRVKEKRERKVVCVEGGSLIMSRIWTESTRADLEFLLKEGYKVPKIAKMMGISPASIYNELKLTLTEEEYKDRRFTKYTADLAWQMERKSRSGKVEINEAAE